MAIVDIMDQCRGLTEYIFLQRFQQPPIHHSIYREEVFDIEILGNEVVQQENEFFNDSIELLNSNTDVITNNTDIPQTGKREFTITYSQSVTSSTTQGYKVGTEIKSITKGTATVKFPLAEVGLEQTIEIGFTGEFNHSTTESTNKTETREWKVTTDLITPPRSRLVATQHVMGGIIEIPMKINAVMTGLGTPTSGFTSDVYLQSWYEYKQSEHDQYFPIVGPYQSISWYLANLVWPNKAPIFETVGDHKDRVKVTGLSKCYLSSGYYSYIEYNQYPLDGDINKIAPLKTYYSDIYLQDGRTIPFSKHYKVD